MQQFKGYIKAIIDKIKILSKFNLKDRWIELGFVFKKILFRKSSKYRPIDVRVLKTYNKHRNKRKKYLLCHAPFKNLYFQSDGNVISCCNNRFYNLGIYPENSITEIWKGRKLKMLRDHIIHDDLSLGCNFCYSSVRAGNYSGMPALAFDEYASQKDYPVSLELELDNTCNLECVMCCGSLSSGIRKNRDKLPPIPQIYDESFINSLDAIIPNLKRVKFIGGEPFLIKIYYAIWDKILTYNPQCVIDLQTNATILNDKMKDLLARGNFRIGVSLDSLNKETYESIRVNAHFATVMKNIKFFSSYAKTKGHPLSISVCPMRINWREIPELILFCDKLDASIYFNTVFFPYNLAIYSLNSQEIKAIYEYLSFNGQKGESFSAKKNQERLKQFLNQINFWYEEALVREKTNISEEGNDVNHLEDKLILKLKKFIGSSNNGMICSDDFGKASNKLKEILSKIPSTKSKISFLITFYNLPTDLIYDLLTNDSYGMMKTLLFEYIHQQNEGADVNYVITYND